MIRFTCLALTIGLTVLISRSGIAETDCESGAACSAAAKAALENHDIETARRAFWRQVDLATGERDEALICDGLENLARVYVQLRKPLRANAWAQTASDRCPGSEARAALAREVAESLPAQHDDRVGGLYWSYAGYGAWNRMTLADQGNGQFAVDWILLRYGLVRSADVGPAGVWDLEASGRLDGDHFIIRYDAFAPIDCPVDFLKAPNALILQNELPKACLVGGAGVRPHGTFWRVEAE